MKANGILGRYAASRQWVFAAAAIDGHPGMLINDDTVPLSAPAYFLVLAFEGERVVSIQDFLFARYALEGMQAHRL